MRAPQAFVARAAADRSAIGRVRAVTTVRIGTHPGTGTGETPANAPTALAIAAAAALTVLAYPPYAIPGLGAVMLAPLVAVLDGGSARRAFAVTWLYSVAMALVAVRWLFHALLVEYRAAPLPSWLFVGLLVGGLAVLPATAAALFARLAPRLVDAAAPIAFAAIWSLAEWLRAAPLGVPWLLVAHTIAPWPIAIQLAEWGGAVLVGFVVTALGAGLGLALRRRSAWPLAAPALLAALALGLGAWRLAGVTSLDTGPSVRIGVVQAAVPQDQRFRSGSAERNVNRHEKASRALARREPLDLLVWSETAIDADLDHTPRLKRDLEALASELGVPIVTGAPRTAGSVYTNSVVLFAPDRGLVESYAKQRLVPYSEYDPAWGAWLAPLLGPVTKGVPYAPGAEATIFRAAPLPFAAPVCFEITYPELVRRFRREGARLLINLSNDAWFGPVGYPEMHLAHAIFRAVELRSWVVRGANTGISAAIDPAGRVIEALPAFSEGTFAVSVTGAGPAPFYARHGDAPILAGLVILALAPITWRPPRRRGRLTLPSGPGRARGTPFSPNLPRG
jgi:apolipoprotein N-acyltransferase